MTFVVLDATDAEQGRRAVITEALALVRRSGPGARLYRAHDGALLAAVGVRLPREGSGARAPFLDPTPTEATDVTTNEEDSLLEKARKKAGDMKALAKAIGLDVSGLYRIERGTVGLSERTKNKLLEYINGATAAGAPQGEDAAGEETGEGESDEQLAESVPEAEAPVAEAPVRSVEPTPPPVAPPAPAAPVVSRAGRTVRLELDADTARGFYQVARAGGFDALALRLADALLGGASDRA